MYATAFQVNENTVATVSGLKNYGLCSSFALSKIRKINSLNPHVIAWIKMHATTIVVLNLTWLFLWTLSIPQTMQIKCLIIITMYIQCLFVMNWVNDQCSNAYMHLLLLGPIDLPVNCRATIVTHNQFLRHNICHTKYFSDSWEKRETSREKQDLSHEKQDERW